MIVLFLLLCLFVFFVANHSAAFVACNPRPIGYAGRKVIRYPLKEVLP